MLQQVQNNPYLGAQISDNLRWTIYKICNRANSILGFIRKHSNQNFKETPYTSYLFDLCLTMQVSRGIPIWKRI